MNALGPAVAFSNDAQGDRQSITPNEPIAECEGDGDDEGNASPRAHLVRSIQMHRGPRAHAICSSLTLRAPGTRPVKRGQAHGPPRCFDDKEFVLATLSICSTDGVKQDNMTSGYRGRFAPSPTGDLHLGSAVAAVFCAAAALAARGTLVLRVEDIDTPRVIPGQQARIAEDLAWLGIRFQEGPDIGGAVGPYVQSQRQTLYEAAIEKLAARGLVYLCDCSRAEIARVASAPHAGDEGPRYPGTCRDFGMHPRAFRRPPAVRLAVPHDSRSIVTTNDLVLGSRTEDVAEVTGDFVLRRGDGIFAYQLAVVVDDLAMGITDVVRGADLASSSARQVLLTRLLGGDPPVFAHVPLLVANDDRRLAKRDGGMTIREQRALGRDPRELVRAIARAYGQEIDDTADPLSALADVLQWSNFPVQPVRVGVLGTTP